MKQYKKKDAKNPTPKITCEKEKCQESFEDKITIKNKGTKTSNRISKQKVSIPQNFMKNIKK